MCALRVISPSRRFLPHRALRVCFASVPLLGFSLQGFSPHPPFVRSLERRNPRDVLPPQCKHCLRPRLQGLAHRLSPARCRRLFTSCTCGYPPGLVPLRGFLSCAARRPDSHPTALSLLCFGPAVFTLTAHPALQGTPPTMQSFSLESNIPPWGFPPRQFIRPLPEEQPVRLFR